MRTLLNVALLSVSVLLLAGCPGKKSVGNPDNGVVGIQNFEGEPRDFSGFYTSGKRGRGECRLQIGNSTFDNCTIKIQIDQSRGRLSVRSVIGMDDHRSRGNAYLNNVIQDAMRIDGKILRTRSGDIGVIGSAAFRYQTADSQLSMIDEPGRGVYRVEGSFYTQSGEQAWVSGTVLIRGQRDSRNDSRDPSRDQSRPEHRRY